MRKLLKYIGINKLGFLELIVAMYPILMGYQYGSIPCTLLFLIIMDILAIFRPKRGAIPSKLMKWLTAFVIVHEVILCVTMRNLPSYHINSIVSLVIVMVSIFIITPRVEYEKLVSSINLVAVICMAGIVYHFALLQMGQYITPIKVPFMPDLNSASRLYNEVRRPCSFFWEPQSYCTFMSVPLFLSLVDKKYTWASTIILSMFLSTSTTGIAISILSLIVFVVTQDVSRYQRFFVVVIGAALIVFLFTSDYFSSGVQKMENTSYETSSRLYNGPTFIANMEKSDLILGINNSNVYDYYREGHVDAFLMEKYDTIFMPSFWNALAKFGLLGIILFLGVYLEPLKDYRQLMIFVIPLIVALFTNPDFLGGLFSFEFIIIYSYMINFKKNENLYSYHTVCE